MVFGGQYSMRVWLDPGKLNSYKLMPSDVQAAITAQNDQISAGQIGGTPALPGQMMSYTILSQDRLETVGQFERIILKVNQDGSTVRLSDVARVELGSESYDATSRFNGKPSTGIAIKLATGANALNTVNQVRATIDQLSKTFPEGIHAVYPYDTTPFVRVSIEEVVKTLAEAILLCSWSCTCSCRTSGQQSFRPSRFPWCF